MIEFFVLNNLYQYLPLEYANKRFRSSGSRSFLLLLCLVLVGCGPGGQKIETGSYVTALAWSPNGERIASIGDWGSKISVFSRTGRLITRIERNETNGPYLLPYLVFLNDNITLLGPAPNFSEQDVKYPLALWNTNTGKLEKVFDAPPGADEPVPGAAYLPLNSATIRFTVSPDGQKVACTSWSGGYKSLAFIYEIKSGKVLKSINVPYRDTQIGTLAHTHPASDATIHALAFSADSSKLAIGIDDGGFVIQDMTNLSAHPYYENVYNEPYPPIVTQLAYSSDGNFIAVGTRESFNEPKHIGQRLLELEAPVKVLSTFDYHVVAFDPDAPDRISQMSWSADSRYLAVAGQDRVIRFYEPLKSGAPVANISWHETIGSLAFSPVDPSLLAVNDGSGITLIKASLIE